MNPFVECRLRGRREGVWMGLIVGAVLTMFVAVILHTWRMSVVQEGAQDALSTQSKSLSLLLNECRGIAVDLARDRHGTVVDYETLRGYSARAREVYR